VLDEIDPHITLTSVKDVAEVVARAVEFEGEWPVVGGMVGTTLKTSEFIALAEKIRGLSSAPRLSSSLLKMRKAIAM
tara:strand:+ start:560 stop:790 length:231 start_codon:yes stop_codon:yes gene_type:complete